MTVTTQHTTQQMIEIQPINSLADIPAEIWIMMGIQLVLMALIFWVVGKLLIKAPAVVMKLVRRSKADAANSSEGGAQ